MKNLIYIFLLLPVLASAQFVNDTLPALPYEEVYYNDFSVGEDWDNFNGGTTAHEATNGLLEVRSATGGSRGALSPYTNEASTEYMIEMYVVDPGNGVAVYSQWPTSIANITTAGWHRIKFTSDASAGGFGNKVIIATTQSDTLKIGFFRMAKINAFRDIPMLSDIDDAIDIANTEADNFLYLNTFDTAGDDTREITLNGATKSFTPANGYMDITVDATGNKWVKFGPRLNDRLDSSYYEILLDCDVTSGSAIVKTGFGSQDKSATLGSGRQLVRLWKGATYVLSGLDGILIGPVSGTATVRIYEIIIRKSPNTESTIFQRGAIRAGNSSSVSSNTNSEIAIGVGAVTASNNQISIGPAAVQNSAATRGIRIGQGGTAEAVGNINIGGFTNTGAGMTGAIAVGDSSEARYNTTYATAGGPDASAFGYVSKAYGWRATAIGGHAIAGAVSSTSIGAGAVSFATHGVALGRGSYIPKNTLFNNTVMTENLDIFLGNGGWHRADAPPNNISMSLTTTPSSREAKYRGIDAFDARTTPADFNVAGGFTGIYPGLATGSGESGSVRLYVGHGNNGQNTKDTARVGAEVRSQENIAAGQSYLWLYDPATSTMKQVLMKTKPASAGTANVVGFQRLSF